MANRITNVTRRNISDAIMEQNILYSGRMDEADFLNRLYDLNSMPSTDYRPEYNTAYKDVMQHADRNPGDWAPDWVFTDARFNLMHVPDEEFIRFMEETVRPLVRKDDGSTEALIEIYNRYLINDRYQFQKVDEVSGRPVFRCLNDGGTKAALAAKAIVIKTMLDTSYVNKQVELMNNTVATNTDLAIGTAKELLETVCKSILIQKNVPIDKNWTLSQLLKNTTNVLDFKANNTDDHIAADRSIRQILGGISSIVQGITELRNSFGSGHGKDADFKGIESHTAKFIVGMVTEMAIYYLATNGKTELSV